MSVSGVICWIITSQSTLHYTGPCVHGSWRAGHLLVMAVQITSFVWEIKMVPLILSLIPNSTSNVGHVREERIVLLCPPIDVLGFDDVLSPWDGKFNSSGLACKGLLSTRNPVLGNKKRKGLKWNSVHTSLPSGCASDWILRKIDGGL